jgi:hypothetical protein
MQGIKVIYRESHSNDLEITRGGEAGQWLEDALFAGGAGRSPLFGA